ncbi:MAG: hypothetical protein V3R99_00875 [Thermoguttaceae bacterium]
MSPAKKKKKKKRPARLGVYVGKLVKYVRGRGVLVTAIVLVVLVVLGLAGGWHLVWREVGDYVLSSESYLVTLDQIEIAPSTLPPEWINTDIREEAFRSVSLDRPLSIMDDDLTERIANAFKLHPWVAKVPRVTKHHPARVRVELIYRRPVCMVEVPGGHVLVDGRMKAVPGGCYPVDARGVVLPTRDFLLPSGDISQAAAGRYPLLINVDTLPMGTVGESWGDARVVGGAEIATVFGDAWKQLRLAAIIASGTSADVPAYALLTSRGAKIDWGRAPGNATAAELPAADKVVRLQDYFNRYGTLKGFDASKEFNVRALRVSSREKR